MRTADFVYHDPDGRPAHKTVRTDRGPKEKSFCQFRWSDGKWVPGLNGGPRYLYNLPALIQAAKTEPERWVYIVEGEKKAERLTQLGFLATCNAMGARGWQAVYAEYLRDRNVAVLEDNDEAGRKWGEAVSASLQQAKCIKRIPFTDLPEHGDVYDWLAQGHTADELAELVEGAPVAEVHAQQVVEERRKKQLHGLLRQAVHSLERPGSSPDEVLAQLRCDFEDLETSTCSSLRFPEHLDGLQMYNAEIRSRPTIVEGGILRPRHYSMIYGQPGKGKSYLLEQLVVSVATGRPWLGLEVVRGRVGVITLEEDREEVQARLKAICAHYSLTADEIQESLLGIRFLTVDELADGVDIERDREIVVGWIQEYELDVVVLDPISDAHTRPEVDNKAMKCITDTLNGICRQTDAAIAISHHTRKSSTSGRGKDDPLDAARGARLMQSCGGAALYLTEHLGTLCIQFAKIRKGGAREHLYLKRIPEGEAGEGCLELTDAPRDSKAQGEANREKVVAIVREAAGERLTLDVVTERYRARHPGEELKERTIRKHLNDASSGEDPSLERHEDDKPFTWSCRLAKVTNLEGRLRKDTALHEGDEE